MDMTKKKIGEFCASNTKSIQPSASKAAIVESVEEVQVSATGQLFKPEKSSRSPSDSLHNDNAKEMQNETKNELKKANLKETFHQKKSLDGIGIEDVVLGEAPVKNQQFQTENKARETKNEALGFGRAKNLIKGEHSNQKSKYSMKLTEKGQPVNESSLKLKESAPEFQPPGILAVATEAEKSDDTKSGDEWVIVIRKSNSNKHQNLNFHQKPNEGKNGNERSLSDSPVVPVETNQLSSESSVVISDLDNEAQRKTSKEVLELDKVNNASHISGQLGEKRTSSKAKKSGKAKKSAKTKFQGTKMTKAKSEQISDQELDLIIEEVTKLDHKEKDASNMPLDSRSDPLILQLKEIKESDFQMRDALFDKLIQHAFDPSFSEEVAEIPPSAIKNIPGDMVNGENGKLRAKEIGSKFGKEDETILNANSLEKNEVEGGHYLDNSWCMNLIKTHLNLANHEDYLSLQPMNDILYEHLKLIWAHKPNLLRGLPNSLTTQFNKHELYRRLNTFQSQIYHRTIVERWGAIKSKLTVDHRFTPVQIDSIEKYYQLATSFPGVQDFTRHEASGARQANAHCTKEVLELLCDIMGYQGAQDRLSMRAKIEASRGKHTKIWKSLDLQQYYEAKGASINDILHLMELMMSTTPYAPPTKETDKENLSYLQTLLTPSAKSVLVPWHQSSTRHWFLKQFKGHYDILLLRLCSRLTERTTLQQALNKQQGNTVGFFESRKARPLAEVLKFQDWGLDGESLFVLFSMMNNGAATRNQSLNWNLIDPHLLMNLNPKQKKFLESHL